MVTLLLILGLMSGKTVLLEPVEERPTQKKNAQVLPMGVGLSTGSVLHFWDEEGNLRLQIEAEKHHRIDAWYHDHESNLLFLSCHDRQGNLYTLLMNEKGKLLDRVEFFSSRFTNVDGTLFTFPISSVEPHIPNSHPFLFTPIKVTREGSDILISPRGPQVAKMPNKLLALELEYSDAWMVAADDGFLVVNEVEPKIYSYDTLEINVEKRNGITIPSRLSGSPVALEGFQGIEKNFDPPKGIYKTNDFRQMRWDWYQSHSRIVGFTAYRDGYLMAYSLPDCQANRNCGESLLGLQKINRDLEAVGVPRIQPGLFAGVKNDEVYILQFEKALTISTPEPPFKPRLLILENL